MYTFGETIPLSDIGKFRKLSCSTYRIMPINPLVHQKKASFHNLIGNDMLPYSTTGWKTIMSKTDSITLWNSRIKIENLAD